jgi:hypothetical protein
MGGGKGESTSPAKRNAASHDGGWPVVNGRITPPARWQKGVQDRSGDRAASTAATVTPSILIVFSAVV